MKQFKGRSHQTKHDDRHSRKSDSTKWNGEIYGKKIIGHGLSGTVFEIDESTVYKISSGPEFHRNDVDIERRAYRRFERKRRIGKAGWAKYVLRCFLREYPDLKGLVLERCCETLRSRLTSNPSEVSKAAMWAQQAAEGLEFVHNCGVIQGDVGCHNMLLDDDDNLKLSDFAGSSIDGSKATVVYEDWSLLPHRDIPPVKRDLFALGSAIYEMSTGHPPYPNKSKAEIQNLYWNEIFPPTNGLALGSVIRLCWERYYSTAGQVVIAIRDIRGIEPIDLEPPFIAEPTYNNARSALTPSSSRSSSSSKASISTSTFASPRSYLSSKASRSTSTSSSARPRSSSKPSRSRSASDAHNNHYASQTAGKKLARKEKPGHKSRRINAFVRFWRSPAVDCAS